MYIQYVIDEVLFGVTRKVFWARRALSIRRTYTCDVANPTVGYRRNMPKHDSESPLGAGDERVSNVRLVPLGAAVEESREEFNVKRVPQQFRMFPFASPDSAEQRKVHPAGPLSPSLVLHTERTRQTDRSGST